MQRTALVVGHLAAAIVRTLLSRGFARRLAPLETAAAHGTFCCACTSGENPG